MKNFFVFTALLICTIIFTSCNLDKGLDINQNNNQNNNQNVESKCNVDFNLNDCYGIATPATQYLEKGSKAVRPIDPTKPGYTFGGWFLDSNCVEEWNFENNVEKHILLYAKWVKDTYTVTFNLLGGEGEIPTSQSLSYLDKVDRPDMNINISGINNPTKENFVFAGWWLSDNGTDYIQEWNFNSDLPSKDMTLYAGWGIVKTNDDYSFIELDSCIKILGYINPNIPEGNLVLPSEINGKPVLSIEKRAFMNFQGCDNIILPISLTTINDEAFYNCSGISDLIISDNVTSIGKMAFHSCNNLYRLLIGKNVTNIGEMAFYQCTNLFKGYADKLTIPSNVLSIEKEAFSITGKAINNLEIKNGLVYIGESAFRYAYILKLSIPDSVEKIDKQAFQYCKYLTKLEIGKGIKNIEYEAFSDCNNSFYIIINSVKVPSLGSSNVFGVFLMHNGVPSRPNFFITVPTQSLEQYKTAPNWATYYNLRITDLEFDDTLIVFPNRE